jgi:DNA polymerase III delta prime subunit
MIHTKHKINHIALPDHKTKIARSIYEYIIMVYGPPGIGKTQFIDELSNSTLFISTDRGTRYRTAFRMEVNNYKELIKTIEALEAEKDLNLRYKIISLDHIDDIATMVYEHTCGLLDIESLGDVGYSKGWDMNKRAMWEILQRILRLNTGVALIAHEAIKTIRTKVIETERLMPDLTKSTWKIIVPKCDIVGYCGFKRVKHGDKKGGEIRIIRTSPLESIYAKDRSTRIKPEEGWERLNGTLFAKTFRKE